MVNRFIITNNSSIEDELALKYVSDVIRQGKISGNGKCYCYVTVFPNNIVVTAKVTKTGFSFAVIGD